jgi:multidrug efflux pump subunit AcrA (membrane-fusion protein)
MKNLNFLLGLLLLQMTILSCSSNESQEEFTVRKGKFEATITETGELQALNARYILMPYLNWKFGWQYKIIDLKEHGAKVKTGEIVARIDDAPIMKAKIETQNKLDMEKANLNILTVQKQSTEESLKSELSIAQASYDMAQLQVQKFKFESEKKQHVKKLEFEIATIALNKIKDQYKLTLIAEEKKVRIQRIKVNQLENDLKDVDRTFELLDIKCTIDGLFQLSINEETKQIVKIGDKVWPGFKIAKVPDLNKMNIQATINETDISKLALNQKVIVRLDAYPVKPFDGKISKIGKISYKKDNESNVKVFDIEVLLDQTDPILKPGMTVSCEILFATLKNSLFVENECIRSKGNHYFVLSEDENKEVPVTLGPKQSKYTVIYGNLSKGEKLVPVQSEEKKIN